MPLIAVIITGSPNGIPITEFPNTVPTLTLICDPSLDVTETL